MIALPGTGRRRAHERHNPPHGYDRARWRCGSGFDRARCPKNLWFGTLMQSLKLSRRSARLCLLFEVPFLIRAATSAKRFLDRARLALRCSISAIFRAFASPYRSRNNPAAAGAFIKWETVRSVGRSVDSFSPPLSIVRPFMTRSLHTLDRAPSPRPRRREWRSCRLSKQFEANEQHDDERDAFCGS